jgi:hypothetical protein
MRPNSLLSGLLILLAACSEATLSGPPAPVVADAAKQDLADENPRIMWQGMATPVTVTGKNFHPLVRDTLTASPGVNVPRLFLTGPAHIELQNVFWVNSETLRAVIPAGIQISDAEGFSDFQIVAQDPDGREGQPAASFRVSTFETPVISGVTVVGAGTVKEYCGVGSVTPDTFDITIRGSNFTDEVRAGFALELTSPTAAAEPMAIASATTDTVVATVPAGLAAGNYDVRITNKDDQQITVLDAFQIHFQTSGCAAITSVFPRFAFRGEDTNLQVLGAGFAATPQISLTRADYAVAVSYPAFLTDTTVQGLLYRDAKRKPGWYAVSVTNPDGLNAQLENALLVVDRPIPRIDSVNPETIASETKVVTIRGEHFPTSFTVAVFNAAGASYAALATTYTNSTHVSATIPGGSMPEGPYVLRLFEETTYGQVYAEYSNIVIVNSSGKTGTFPIQTSKLDTGRREFGLVGSRNSIGTRYLYAVGGRTDNGVKPGPTAILSTVEIAAIDAFGRLGDFYPAPTTIGVPLYGLGIVQIDEWLYALGGSSPTGPSNLALKAQILDPRQAPEILDVSTGSGVLDAGNWLYKVSAVMGPADTENPNGETLPSIEVGHILSAQGAIRIDWRAVSGAASYRIYRTPEAGARSGTQVLLSQVLVAGNCLGDCSFVDDGSLTSGTARPLPPGSLSVWTPAGTLSVPRAFHVTALARNENNEPFIYAISGIQTATGAPISDYDFAPVTAGQNLAFPVTPAATTLGARRHASAAVANENNVNPLFLDGTNWISILAGSSAALSSNAGNQTGIQKGRISATGAITDVGAMTGGNNAQARTGSGSVFAANHLFQIGGATNYAGTTAELNIYFSSVNSIFGLQNFRNNGDGKLSRSRSYYGITRFNAQIFIIGGSYTDGTVTREIESVFY